MQAIIDLLQRLDSPAERLVAGWVGVILLAVIANFLARRVIVRGMRAVASRTKTRWDDVLVEHRVFERLSHLAPALVVYVAAPLLLNGPESKLSTADVSMIIVHMSHDAAASFKSLYPR